MVAWRAFSALTGAPLLIGNRGERLPKADWGPSVGLPKLPCLTQRIVLPRWGQVKDMLAQFPKYRGRAELKEEAPKSLSVLWKRWAPRDPLTLNFAGGCVLGAYAVTSVCPKRRVGEG